MFSFPARVVNWLIAVFALCGCSFGCSSRVTSPTNQNAISTAVTSGKDSRFDDIRGNSEGRMGRSKVMYAVRDFPVATLFRYCHLIFEPHQRQLHCNKLGGKSLGADVAAISKTIAGSIPDSYHEGRCQGPVDRLIAYCGMWESARAVYPVIRLVAIRDNDGTYEYFVDFLLQT